jgi:hypothetical protein
MNLSFGDTTDDDVPFLGGGPGGRPAASCRGHTVLGIAILWKVELDTL